MDLRAFVEDSMKRTRHATLNIVRDLNEDQLRWTPESGTNNVGFLLFHALRAEDMYFHNAITMSGEIWVREGWCDRWTLPNGLSEERKPITTGNSWTMEEVESWRIPPLDEMLAYGDAVRQSSLDVLREFDLARLDERPRPNRPDMTIAGFLFLASHHESQHLGQMDYLTGLMRG